MTFRERLSFLFSSKESQTRIISTMTQVGRAQVTPANYESFAKQGYSRNLIVYAAISKISTACKGINWVLYSKKKSSNGRVAEIEQHDLLSLMQRPNPLQPQASFIESVVGFKLIAGNSYIELNRGLSGNGPILELWPARPDRMKVIPGAQGYPKAYEFAMGQNKREFPVDPVTLKGNIVHWKSFNPLNDWYGLSALEAAMLVLDQNNAGSKWNLAMMQNQATPSGVLQVASTEYNPRGELTDEQFKRVKQEVTESYTGARNAGKPMLLEGNLKWQSISLSPKEMDFINSRNATAIELCIALGVPPEVMGLGQKTFNNYEEARLSFYDETVIPTMDDLRDTLNSTIVPAFGEDLYLDYDRDSIEALKVRTSKTMTSLQGITYLTINEKRAKLGYDEIEGGEELDRPSASVFGSLASDETEDDENPKKPVGQGDESEDAESEDEEPKTMHWKSINLLTRNEKRKSWALQNAWRKRLAENFTRDLEDDYQSLAKKLGNVADSLKGQEQKVIEFALLKALDEWASTDLRKTLRSHIRTTIVDFGNMALGEGKSLGFDKEQKANLKFDSFVRSYVERHTATQIRTISSGNEKTIRRVVSQYVSDEIEGGDGLESLSSRLEARFGELNKGQAQRIARTEVGSASTQGTLEAVKSLSIPNMFKEWVSANDGRVRDGDAGGADHAIVNGQEVPLDEKFSVPPDCDMEGPGDPSAPADQIINCRCVVTFRSKN